MNYAGSYAEFDSDVRYRYSLERWFNRTGERSVLFVGLNPSTADEHQDDPTIRRCVGFARDWGFDRYLMGNIHALRSTDPKALYVVADPVGRHNPAKLAELMDRAELVVAAWGANKLSEAAAEIAVMILSNPKTRCLGLTKQGAPKHPLYLPKNTALITVLGKGYVSL